MGRDILAGSGDVLFRSFSGEGGVVCSIAIQASDCLRIQNALGLDLRKIFVPCINSWRLKVSRLFLTDVNSLVLLVTNILMRMEIQHYH